MRKLLALAFVAAMVVLGGHTTAAQGVNDFTIHNFDAQYVIDDTSVGGSLETTETIELTFSGQNRGILRAIPEKHRGFDTNIKILEIQRDDKQEQYDTYGENDNTVIRIGDPDVYITGKHTYKIRYTQERILRFDNGPEFYWDINGNDWQQVFENVSASLTFTSGSPDPSRLFCFIGKQGSKEQACTIQSVGGQVNVASNRPLRPGENLTMSVAVQGGNYVQPGQGEKIADNMLSIFGLALGLAGSIGTFILWWKRGRDYSGKGVIVPQYEPPKGLAPAEVGMLADYKVDGRDLSATLIDLAVRGYVRLHEKQKKIIGITFRSYQVELQKSDASELKPYEKSLLEGVFGAGSSGQIVELSKLDRTKMHTSVTSARSHLQDSLMKQHGYIEEGAHTLSTISLVLGAVIFFCSFFFISIAAGLFIGALLFGGALFIAGLAMPRRSHAGVEVYEHIKGLELYMNTAEKQRLKMMQSVERLYAEPSKTVELFETLLPFAVALGVEKSWAKQFDGILTESPDWYTGNNVSAFSAAHIASGVTSATSSFSSSFESSSGASGGGGSSGGGGGGGGGGGW